MRAAFLLLILVSSSQAKLTAEDLIQNKRTGDLVWGEHIDIYGVGGARVTAFTEVEKSTRNPLSAGVKITYQVLDAAPELPCKPFPDLLPNACAATWWVNFPKDSIFGFAGVDFNRGGHSPKGVFDVPHFDIHFFLRTQPFVKKFIAPGTGCGAFDKKTFLRLNKPIPAKCYPKGFLNVGAATPLMGNHLIDPTAKEFTKPGSFDANFVWGSFDGQIQFFEPMITLQTFKDKKAYCGDIPSVPEEFPKAGWYPTTWCYYSYPNGDTWIELRDFVWKSAGCKDRSQLEGYLTADPKTIPRGCKYNKPPKPAGK